ncbi:MAG: hypothetical protein Q7R96_00455 [Nanoarchaeota archaeon]|nr:hypothetical protein [Nanoarchaeota archaeon]
MKKRARRGVVIIEQKVDAAFDIVSSLLVMFAIVCFAFGFALFITAVTKLLESDNPWLSLLVGAGLMIIPVVFGVWRLQYLKKKIFHNLKRLKID